MEIDNFDILYTYHLTYFQMQLLHNLQMRALAEICMEMR